MAKPKPARRLGGRYERQEDGKTVRVEGPGLKTKPQPKPAAPKPTKKEG